MPKKLTIAIMHYHEPWEVCKPLFDSIDLQHGIDFDDFKVLLVNDGDDVVLDKALFNGYRYDVEYAVKPHGGVSDSRNYAIDHSDTDYLMFCDSDDMFLSMYGLHLVFGAIQEGFDLCIGSFIEEQPFDGEWKIFRRDKNKVFCHAKVYRRQFLLDKKLRFDTALYFSEDSVFNNMACLESAKTKYIETPFYLWAWNPKSTVRRDRETLVLREYAQVMLMRTKICEGLRKRGFEGEFLDSVCKTITDCYFDFQEKEFVKPGHERLVERAEKEFKKFYRQYSRDFMACDSERIGKALMESRLTAYDNGFRMERTDLKSWLKHIKNEVKI